VKNSRDSGRLSGGRGRPIFSANLCIRGIFRHWSPGVLSMKLSISAAAMKSGSDSR